MELKSPLFDDVAPFDILMREEFSDVRLHVGDQSIAVHQLVLAAHSPLLERMFSGHNNVDTDQEPVSLSLAEVEMITVTKMVEFLYSGQLLTDKDSLCPLLSLATRLQLWPLATQIEELQARLAQQDIIREETEVVKEEAITNDDLNNASFMSLSGLDNLVESELSLGDPNISIHHVPDPEPDLQTPVQSPDPLAHTIDLAPIHFCDICNEAFTTEQEMNHHKDIHSVSTKIEIDQCDGFVYTCANTNCEFYTEEKIYFDQHVEQCEDIDDTPAVESTSPEKAFPCLECGKSFSRSHQLKLHKRTHTGERPFKCEQCGKCFTSTFALKTHIAVHGDDKPHKCTQCDKAFKDRANLRQHIATHSDKRPHQCPICDKGFTFKRNMVRHAETHKKNNQTRNDFFTPIFKCESCMKIFSSHIGLIEHKAFDHSEIHTNNPFKCNRDDCAQMFSTEALYLSHIEVAHGIKGQNETEILKYPCQFCFVQFVNQNTLNQHLKMFHGNNAGFQCSLCKKRFKTECDMKAHMQDHSNKKRKYVCEHCNKAWAKPSDLEKHLRIHTGEKPFHCEFCDKRFADKSFFLKHRRTHTEEQMFVCGVCEKKFVKQENLERHMNTHTCPSFACSACGKKFYDEVSLSAHINLHKGVNPYTCSVCQKEFSIMSELTKHERTHTGVKPFKCGICSKPFTDLSSLRKHERRHLIVNSHEQILCFGCGKDFQKEEAFFKHATLLRSSKSKNKNRCFGKPKECPDTFHPNSTLRCLHCKVTLHSKEEFIGHLDNENCKGPLYARLSKPSESQLKAKVESKDDVFDAITHLNEVIQTIKSPENS